MDSSSTTITAKAAQTGAAPLGNLLTASARIPIGDAFIHGDLVIPYDACGLVIFAHGSGSSRHSKRNRFVAECLRERGCATLLFDLLTHEEEAEDAVTGHLRFNIHLLARRLMAVTRWAREQPQLGDLPFGYFGSSTGAAAALGAAVALRGEISVVVSRGGRPDLVMESLRAVDAATLFIVGDADHLVLTLNQKAYAELVCEKGLAIIPGATHLFEEPGALEEVACLAADWFRSHFEAMKRNVGIKSQ